MFCLGYDDCVASKSPLFAVEDFYLAQYSASRRRSVDTGGLALALKDSKSMAYPPGQGWGIWDDQQQTTIPCAEMLSRLYVQTMPSSCLGPDAFAPHMSPGTRLRLLRTIGNWEFDPLALSSEDLFDTVCLIFDVIFTIEGASEEIGIQAHELRPLLLAIRSVYSHENAYHNFQHAVDVLQAMHTFLADAGCVPPISVLESPRALNSPKWRRPSHPKGTLKDILTVIDVFMLFLAAIGHDAGHPGLNNGFMKSAGTCLSDIFDHTSTLERMHCTLLLQLMRNFGLEHLIRSDNILFGSDNLSPTPSSTNIRAILVDTVLATDMSLHFRWIKEFEELIDNHGPRFAIEPMSDDDKKKAKIFACQALMKCADISNPVRPHTISEAWSRALLNEWYGQASLERTMALPSSVPSRCPPPSRPSIFTPLQEPGTSSSHIEHHRSHTDPFYSLSDAYERGQPDPLDGWDATEITAAKEQVKVQVSFIDVFTSPLYAALSRFAPELGHFHSRCTQNRQIWQMKADELSELEAELGNLPPNQHERADRGHHAAAPMSAPSSNATSIEAHVDASDRAEERKARHDARSSFDSESARAMISPDMSDFSFNRRTSESSISSVPTDEAPERDSCEDDGAIEGPHSSTPTARQRKDDAAIDPPIPGAERRSSKPGVNMPSPLLRPHVRNYSIASSTSSYYTASSSIPLSPVFRPKSLKESNSDVTVNANLFDAIDNGHTFVSSPGPLYTAPIQTNILPLPRNPMLASQSTKLPAGGAFHSHSYSLSYRVPLGIEMKRSAYQAHARRKSPACNGADEYQHRLSLTHWEFPFRRRSMGPGNILLGSKIGPSSRSSLRT